MIRIFPPRAALMSVLSVSISLSGCGSSSCPEDQKMGSVCIATQDGGSGDAECVDPQLSCPGRDHASATCVRQTCSFTCSEGYDDCDGEVRNGCEASLQSRGHCGGCNIQCAKNSDEYCAANGCRVARAFGARLIGGSRPDYLHAMATDKHGNVVLAGSFDDAAFSDHPLAKERAEYPLGTVHVENRHLISLTPAGTVRWAWTLNSAILDGPGSSSPGLALRHVALDSVGDVYVAGTIKRTSSVALLREGLEVEVPISNFRHDDDIVVLRFRGRDGMLRWATRLGSDGEDTVTTLAAIPNEVYLGGSFKNGAFPLGALGYRSSEAAKHDGFIARFDQDHQSIRFDRAITFGGAGDDSVLALELTGVGGVLAGGFIEGAVRINTQEIGRATSLAPFGFVAHLDADLATQAALAFSGPRGNSTVTGLATSPEGGIYAAGFFEGTLAFGSVAEHTSTGVYNGYVTRLDEGLKVVWVRSLPGPGPGVGRRPWDRLHVAAKHDHVFVGGEVPLKLRAQDDLFAPDPSAESTFLMSLRADTGDGQWLRGWQQDPDWSWISLVGISAARDGRLLLAGSASGTWTLAGDPATPRGTDAWTLEILY